jgi:gluconolactonase
MALAALVAGGLIGCGSSGGGGGSGGAGGSGSGSGGTATGSGGAATGSGGSGTGGAAVDASGSGGAGTGSGGSGSGGATTDGGNDAAGGASALHGGTSGAYICPAGANYAGMMPSMNVTFTLSTGATTNNGEGPVWVGPLNALIFSSKFNGDNFRQIWKLAPPNAAQVSIKTNVGNNGMTLDNDDKIVSADHQLSAIVRLDPATGNMIDMIANQYMGKFFQSPNDVIVRGDGNIYFSDPAYFASQGKTPKTAATAFYRISPAKEVSIIESTGTKDPNGVALSPDDNTLYTLVTADRQVKKWALNADGSINGAGVNFAATGSTPDGMCVDCAGNLYVATTGGLQVFSPAGQMITTIGSGTKAINCSFGGADHKTLFITNDDHVRYGTVSIPGLP